MRGALYTSSYTPSLVRYIRTDSHGDKGDNAATSCPDRVYLPTLPPRPGPQGWPDQFMFHPHKEQRPHQVLLMIALRVWSIWSYICIHALSVDVAPYSLALPAGIYSHIFSPTQDRNLMTGKLLYLPPL